MPDRNAEANFPGSGFRDLRDSIYDIDPETGFFRDPLPPVPDELITAAREKAVAERYAVLDAQVKCPDGGACHHFCGHGMPVPCFRVRFCEPLSGAYPDGRWPENVLSAAGVPAQGTPAAGAEDSGCPD
jgi:hypothetical protein